MAKDKKGFILYADQKEIFDQLPNEKAGELIKHIFSYVNDDEPETDDPFINLAFTPIKQQFKRDLQKWEKTREGRSKAGKASAEARRNKKEQESTNSTNVNFVQQNSTNPTVNDTVNVTVNVNDKVNDILLEKDKKEIFDEWINYRKEIKKPIKAKSTLKKLIETFNATTLEHCQFTVSQSIGNSYQGLIWDKFKKQNNNGEQQPKIGRQTIDTFTANATGWNELGD